MSRLSLAAATLAGALFAGSAPAATVAISCGAVGQELELCREGAEAWAEKTGHTVQIVSTPNSSTERLALYQQILAAGASDIDVYQIDVIWPGILAQHFIDLTPYVGDAPEAHFEAIVKNNTVDGKLVAMPWFTDAGVLYYRKDLLEKYDEPVPETWQQMTETARTIQAAEREAGNDKMWGFVWQGRAYEGLTCNALEWIASFNGGSIVAPDGEITIANPNAAEAVTLAASWIDTISPRGVLNYAEEEARGVFQTGNAVFMRNWPYAWALAQSPDSPIKGKVGVTALPKGGEDGRHAAALGGWQLAVSRYSENPEVAADLVRYLTSYEEQKRRAIEASYNPTIRALYKDEEVLAAVPFFGELYDTFVNAVPRPSTVTGDQYNRVSNAFYNAVHDVLSGNAEAEPRLSQLRGELMRISRGGRW
jgi:trehalose/maltose transport system substrate-binding protein